MIGYVVLKILTYQGTFVALLSFLGRIYSTADLILDFLTQIWIIPLISLYSVAYISWIYIQDGEELKRKKKFARALSLPIWIIVLAFSSSFCGFLHVFVFVACSILIGLIASGVIGKFGSDEEPSVDTEVDPGEAINKAEEPASILPEMNLEQAITSDRILRITASLFALLWTSKHDLILIILLILFLYGFILNVGKLITSFFFNFTLFSRKNSTVGQHLVICPKHIARQRARNKNCKYYCARIFTPIPLYSFHK